MSEALEIDESFYKDLEREDDLGAVIRAHIHIESSVQQFIEAMVKAPNQLPRLQYSHSLKLACALGLDTDYLPALQCLGEIRNQFGHRLNEGLSHEQTKRLYELLPKHGKDWLESTYKQLADHGFDDLSPFLELFPRDQFNLIAIILKSVGVASAHAASSSSAPNNSFKADTLRVRP